jgi:prepilin-type N-terminal cleavage/methylation domain-containing protein
MKTKLRPGSEAGFTLIELLVVMAIVSILIEFARTAPRVDVAALRLSVEPRFAKVSADILAFNQAAAQSASAFRLGVGDDALAADDASTAVLHLDPLQSYCDADSRLSDLESQVNALLAADGTDPWSKGPVLVVQARRDALIEAKNAIAAELPAVQKLANLLRTKGGATCPPVLE